MKPLCILQGAASGTYAEFRIRGDFKHAKMSDVSKFKKVVSESLNIPRRHINLCGIGKGSIIIVFQVPDIGIERLRKAIKCRDSWLYEHGVLEVHIDGEQCVRIQDDHPTITTENTGK